MAHKKQPVILFADDEEVIRKVIRGMLGGDYALLEAENGEEAVRLAKSHKPDIILMDTFMPKMDGYTACFELKKDDATKSIPVVAVTGQAGPLQEKMVLAMGVNAFLSKPFTKEELLGTITSTLEGGS